MLKERINYITIAKGIGIILVVLGHCGNDMIEKFVLLFHMPLFFFLSGYLFKDEKLDTPKEYIKSKVLKLYIPYLIYETIFLLLHNFFIDINIYNTNIMIRDKTITYLSVSQQISNFIRIVLCMGREPIGGALWFLVVLFFVSIIFFTISYILKRIVNNKEYEKCRFIIIFVLFIIGNLLTKFGFTIPRFNNTLVMLFLYYLGFVTKKYLKHIKFESTITFIVCIIGLLVNNTYGGISVNTNIYLSPDFLIINTLIGTYAVLYISKKIEKMRYLSKVLISIGNGSLYIMCLHFLAFKIVSIFRILIEGMPIWKLAYFPVIKPSDNWIILYVIVGVTIPLIIGQTINKIKILRMGELKS